MKVLARFHFQTPNVFFVSDKLVIAMWTRVVVMMVLVVIFAVMKVVAIMVLIAVVIISVVPISMVFIFMIFTVIFSVPSVCVWHSVDRERFDLTNMGNTVVHGVLRLIMMIIMVVIIVLLIMVTTIVMLIMVTTIVMLIMVTTIVMLIMVTTFVMLIMVTTFVMLIMVTTFVMIVVFVIMMETMFRRMRKLPVIIVRVTVVMVIRIMNTMAMFLIDMVINVSMWNLPHGESFNIVNIVDAVVHRVLLMGVPMVVAIMM